MSRKNIYISQEAELFKPPANGTNHHSKQILNFHSQKAYVDTFISNSMKRIGP